jgi:hypothetical protein
VSSRDIRNEGIRTYIESMTDDSNDKHLRSGFKEVLDAGYYGFMHIWLRENDAHDDEFVELWHAYQLPALLPFGLALNSLESPVADLRKRIQRIAKD